MVLILTLVRRQEYVVRRHEVEAEDLPGTVEVTLVPPDVSVVVLAAAGQAAIAVITLAVVRMVVPVEAFSVTASVARFESFLTLD